ncbi:hypothetical protein [Streptomyces sp. NPDC060054]|uniref:hypothetical protein n=1 Tax=Streptomyces sp. NPDC060054 TaxID=3347048 RepID=UPI00093B926D|nr:hypothetical protein A6A29_37660 [Streptomyces sp. TSRI0281]
MRLLIDQGLDVHDIAAELTAWWIDWRPVRPAALITARLRARLPTARRSIPEKPRTTVRPDLREMRRGRRACIGASTRRRPPLRAPTATGSSHGSTDGTSGRESPFTTTRIPTTRSTYGSRLCCYAVKKSAWVTW